MLEETNKLICPVRRIKKTDLICPVKSIYVQPSKNNGVELSVNRSSNHSDMISISDLETGMVRMRALAVEAKFVIFNKTIKIPKQYQKIYDFMIKEFSKWRPGFNIFISSGTGTGKTYFVEKIVEMNRFKILILTNRLLNKMQIEEHLASYINDINSLVTISSYQEFETREDLGKRYLDSFDIIVMDESHYFLKDSTFNNFTPAGYLKIMSAEKPIKLFLSATNDDIMQKIVEDLLVQKNETQLSVMRKVINYSMEYNSSAINKIISFVEIEDLIESIVKSKDKWLIFVKSKKEANLLCESLSKYYREKFDYIFISRESVDEGNFYETMVYDSLVKNSKFSQKILIATSILDNGVNIIDTELKNIVIFESNSTEMVQMAGRKRCLNGDFDTFNLYLKDETKKSLAGSIQKNEQFHQKLLRVKYEMLVKDDPNQVFFRNGREFDEYRRCVFKDPFTHDFAFNELGKRQNELELYELNKLKNSNSSFDIKANYINSKLTKKAEKVDIKSHKFLMEIDNLIDVKIDNKDKDSRALIGDTYLKIYGREDSSDKKNRPLTIEKIRERFIKRKIPLKVIEEQSYFILTKSEKM